MQSVLARSPHNLRLALECCQEKGASSWLSVIPIEQLGSHFTRLILRMLCVYAMAGSDHTYLLTVFMAKPLLFLMLLAARTVLFPLSAIMMYEI